MGIFNVDIELSKTPTSKKASVKKMIVDTGSEATWVPEEVLRGLRIGVRKKDQRFVMAKGETITRDIGYAVIRSGEFETIDEVVFAKKGDYRLLGARTLEGFNARVDSVARKLVAAGPLPATGNRAHLCKAMANAERSHRVALQSQPRT